MSSQKRVILLNRFFFPDQSPTSVLLSDLAFALSEQGLAVTVITSRLRYDDRGAKLPAREAVRGVQIRRVWSFRAGQDHLAERALEYLSFYLNAAWTLWRSTRPGDVIIAKSDPPLLSIPAAAIARMRGARLINWLQDLFPEVAEQLAVAGDNARPAFRFLRPLRNWSLSAATLNVVPGARMAQTLEREGIAASKIEVIPNWSDGNLIKAITPEANELRKQWGLDPFVVVGYVGNFGRGHEFETILQAMSLHQQQMKSAAADPIARRIVFLLVGGGAQRRNVEREIAARGLKNVMLRPYQPVERLAETLAAADIHLVSLKPELEGLLLPSKFYGIAAAARPTIFVGSKQGEIAQLIEEVNCGATVEPGDGEALLSEIIELARDPAAMRAMGARARAAFESKWEKQHALARWQSVMDRNIAARVRGPAVGEARSAEV